ncbi:hypothetical protein MJH12_09045, partial [bacterium]|nr:hypothetical protein [bacterium]
LSNVSLSSVQDSEAPTDSIDSATLPQVTQDTVIKFNLTVTDSTNGKKAKQALEVLIRSPKRPPEALVYPQFSFTQSNTNEAVYLSGEDSFVRGEGDLSYKWSFDREILSFAQGSISTDSEIALIAATDIDINAVEEVSLKVTASNGLSSSVKAFVRIKKRAAALKYEFEGLDFEENFDLTTRRVLPIRDSLGVPVYKKTDIVKVTGFAFDPLFLDEVTVNASLYGYDPMSQSATSLSTGALFTSKTYSGKLVDFSYSSTSLTTAASYYALLVTVSGSNSNNTNTKLLPFRVRPDVFTKALLPKALALIDNIETESLGVITVSSDVYSAKFSDDFVFVTLDGSSSTNPAGGSLSYAWTHSWVGSIRDTEGAPTLRFLGLNKDKVVFGIPLSQKSRTLQLTLKVKDIDSKIESKGSSVLITLASQQGSPPIANAGEDEDFVMAAQDSNIEVSLNGFGSFSPVGHQISYKWTHRGAGTSVFAGQSFSTEVAPVVTLEEGVHYFQLLVSDLEDSTVEKSTDLVIVRVEKERVVQVGVLWEVEGQADAFPREAFTNKRVDIKAEFHFFPSEANINPSPTNLFKHSVLITKLNEDGTLGGVFSQNLYSARKSVTPSQFTSAGEYLIEVVAWVDTDNNGLFDQSADFSYSYQEKFVISVEEQLFPIRAFINTAGKAKFLADASIGTSIQVTFQAKHPNNGNWTYEYRFALFNVENFEEAITSNVSVADSLNVISSEGAFVVTAIQDFITVTFSNVLPGEYEMALEVEALNENDAELQDFKGFYFRVVSNNIKMFANVIDPEQKLDWSAISVDFYPVTSQSLDKKSELAFKYSTNIAASIDAITQDRLFEYDLPANVNGLEIVGILVEVVDTAALNANNAVKIAQFFPEIPREGEFYVDLVNRDASIEIEGTYLKPGDYFSFNLDQVLTSAEDENGNDRLDLDLSIGTTTILVSDSSGNSTQTTKIRAITFATLGSRRVIPVQAYSDVVGEEVDAQEFFERALSNGGNIVFDPELFEEGALSGAIIPQMKSLYMVEFQDFNGFNQYALMIISFSDQFGFAFRYAKATETFPEINFGGAIVRDQIELFADFEENQLHVAGGVPGSFFTLVSSSAKGYLLTGTGTASSDCQIGAQIQSNIAIETCVGKFNAQGEMQVTIELDESNQLVDGDYVAIEAYIYENLQGDLRNVDLPNPIRFIFREEKFGGFGLGYSKVTSATQFEIAYFGQAKLATIVSANMILRVSDVFDLGLYNQAASLNIVKVTTQSILEGEISGKIIVDIDPNAGVDLTDMNSYVSFLATTQMLSLEGDIVERRRHIISMQDLYAEDNINGLLKVPTADTKWLEIREDDYGYKSQPYLKTSTKISGITYYEY